MQAEHLPVGPTQKRPALKRAILKSVFANLHVVGFAVASAVIGAIALAAPTVALLVQGAEPNQPIGTHLAELSLLFPGYTVSWSGVFIGALYGAALAACIGALVALLWNASRHLYLRLMLTKARLRVALRDGL